jgi:malonate transporter MadM subunit
MNKIIEEIFISYNLVGAVMVTSVIIISAYYLTGLIKQKRMGSAIAIIIGLFLAYVSGKYTKGSNGIADIAAFSGFGVLGGGMLRDYTIISTAFGVKTENLKKAGIPGIIALVCGIIFSFIIGSMVAIIAGFNNPIDVATIGGGAVTFVVGPITGGALGASSDVIALSIATGVVKAILTMIITPFIAPIIKLDNPTSAMVYGGMIGTTSGVAGGLAATDPKLVPYGAMTATFYTGLGSLFCPSFGFMLIRKIMGG